MLPRLRALFVALFVTLLTPAAPAAAHDYWLEFDPLQAPPGEALGLSLYVGEDFVAEEHKAMQRDRTVSFRQLYSTGEPDLLSDAVDGAKTRARIPATSQSVPPARPRKKPASPPVMPHDWAAGISGSEASKCW